MTDEQAELEARRRWPETRSILCPTGGIRSAIGQARRFVGLCCVGVRVVQTVERVKFGDSGIRDEFKTLGYGLTWETAFETADHGVKR